MTAQEQPLYKLKKAWPSSPIRHHNHFVVIMVVTIFIAGGVFLFLQARPPTQENNPPISQENLNPKDNKQLPEGPLYGLWGQVLEITPAANDPARLKVRWDLDQDYLVEVDNGVVVNKYALATEKAAPSLLSKDIGWQNLKVGDRVYLDTQVDVLQTTQIEAAALNSIDLYVEP